MIRHSLKTERDGDNPWAVGIVVPVYNRATVILPTLESIAEQTLLPTKLVVVNDGSTDQTSQAVQAWIEGADPPFEAQLLHQSNLGPAAARNKGLQCVAELPLVAFLDSDDIWPRDFLARAVPLLAEDPSAAIVSVDRLFLNADGVAVRFDDCQYLAQDPLRWMFQNGSGVSSCSLLRMSAVLKTQRWPEDASSDGTEDSRFFAEMALQGAWLHATGNPVRLHLGNAESRGEEGNLSGKHADNVVRWAAAYDEILNEISDHISDHQYAALRHLVANFWYRAGKQLDGLGKRDDAVRCYDRAIRFQPTMLRAIVRRMIGRAA